MNTVFVNSCNIISALGLSAEENYMKVRDGISGVVKHQVSEISQEPFCASLIGDELLSKASGENSATKFKSKYEQLLYASVKEALIHSDCDPADSNTVFIFSTTKGNISLLENSAIPVNSGDTLGLSESADRICSLFGNPNKPVVISNACISGVVALLHAKRLLESGIYKCAIVTGADTINRFIHSGFQSFQALSTNPCKPFSQSREGINLGEAAATVILSVNNSQNSNNNIYINGGAITNDANHISGPSRTGTELAEAIKRAVNLSDIALEDIGFISAHGTATPFNDEMEAKAIHLAGLQNIPVHSLKNYFGHTLGAAGLVESVISILSLKHNELIASGGFEAPSVLPAVKVIQSQQPKKNIKNFIKTASGFGGCNAALVFSKS